MLHMTLPKKIGRYEVLEQIGQGGIATVYKARDPARGRFVAVKTIKPGEDTAEKQEELRARFAREARAAGVL